MILIKNLLFFMSENASFQGKFAKVSFDNSYENQLSYFQNGYFSKILWSFYDPYNQVKYTKKFKWFTNLFINKIFEYTFVRFVSDQSLIRTMNHKCTLHYRSTQVYIGTYRYLQVLIRYLSIFQSFFICQVEFKRRLALVIWR